MKPPGQKRQRGMCGKKKPLCPEPDLNKEENRSTAPLPPIGNLSGNLPWPETIPPSPPMYEYVVSISSLESALDLREGLRANVPFPYSMVRLDLENPEERGRKPRLKLTLRILDPSGGMAIRVNQLLLSMNFVEVSTSRTYSDGLIDIQCLWKQKEEVSRLSARKFGSQAICTQTTGTQTWIS